MLELHVCDRLGAVLRSFAIGDTPEVIVGREDGCDIQIRSPSISREHCLVEQQGVVFILRDLDSTGGTFVNGDRIDSIRITDGMEARVGPAVLRFSVDDG